MDFRIIAVPLLSVAAGALTLRTGFLLIARKPVLAELVASSLPESTRYSHRRWQLAQIGDALSAADAPQPTEHATIRVRYTVGSREYFKELHTAVRRGGRPDPTLVLWYDPSDPCRATDKGISWLALLLAYGLLIAVTTRLI